MAGQTSPFAAGPRMAIVPSPTDDGGAAVWRRRARVQRQALEAVIRLQAEALRDEPTIMARAVALARAVFADESAPPPDITCYVFDGRDDARPRWRYGSDAGPGGGSPGVSLARDADIAARTAATRRAVCRTDDGPAPDGVGLALLSAPILAGEALLGVINAYRPAGWPFEDDDLAALEAFADGIALALRAARTRARLAETDLRARDLVDHAPDAVLLHTAAGRILEANAAAGDLLGRAPAALVGTSLADHLPPAASPAVGDRLAATLTAPPAAPHAEFAYRRADGRAGTMHARTRRLRRTDAEGLPLLQTIARDVTAEVRQREALEARVRELAMLIGVGESLNSSLDLAAVLRETLRALTTVVACPAATIRLYDERRRLLVPVAVQGWPVEERAVRAVPLDEGQIGAAVRQGRIAFVPDVNATPGMAPLRRPDTPRAILIVPVLHGDEPLGCFTLLRPLGASFDEGEQRLAAAVARQTAIAIENAQLFGRVQRQLHEITELQGLAADLVSDLDLDPTLARICRTLADLLGAEQTGVRFLSDDGAELTLAANHGLSPALAAHLARTPAEGQGDAPRALGTRELVVTPDLARDTREWAFRDELRRHGVAALCTVPILGRDHEPLGALFAAWSIPHEPTAEEAEIVRAYANYAAVAIGNARLYKRTRELYLAGIQSLAATVDARDAYTHRHSRNVAFYARAMARELGLPQAEVETIELAALLHDIGKIGISDAILSKPGRLSTGEMSIMITHAQQGAAILSVNEALAPLVPLVRHHHEWYGGGGYPDGLAGDAIPLGAAIIAVADAFDTMTTDRAYRRARSLAGARAELRRNVGRQFHPAVVAAFLEVLERDEEAGEDYVGRLRELGTGALREPLPTLAEALDAEVEDLGQIRPQQLKELAVLHHLARTVGTITDLDRFLAGVVALIRRQLGYEDCAILLRDAGDELVVRAVGGFAPDFLGRRLGRGTGAAGWVIATGQTRNVPDIERDALYIVWRPASRSALLVPLPGDGEAMGVIAIESKRIAAFSADDEVLLETVATQLATAIAVARLHDEEKRAAITDGLTGVHNHRYFYQRLEEELAISARQDSRLAVLILDVNGLKALNDTHGHLAGDAALRVIAATLKECTRDGDTVARYGGDEFAIILPGAEVGDAQRLVTRLRARLLAVPTQGAPLTVAAGIAARPADGVRAPALVAAADERMYTQKRAGRAAADRAETRRQVLSRLAGQ